MTRILNARERKALDKIAFDHRNFHIRGELVGIGTVTLDALVDLGLLETGPSQRYDGEIGWRVTPDGARCMYGKTFDEMKGSGPYHPLTVWSWPPSDR
jgi:hypothetical protein